MSTQNKSKNLMQYLFSASTALATVRIVKPTEYFLYLSTLCVRSEAGSRSVERTSRANDCYKKRFPVTIPRQNNFNRGKQ